MKRSGFKQKTLEEVKARQAEKRSKLANTTSKVLKTTKVPRWVKSIPESQAHGSGTFQKRLWKLTSDYVRIRDFYKYRTCAATGKRFEHWKDSHAGHLKPYSTCNCLFKFDVRNIHAQHGNSNKFGNYDDFRNFEKEVKRRGYDWDLFEVENNKENGCRLYDTDVIERMKELLTEMKGLPEQPDYYERATLLLEEELLITE